MAPLPVIPDVFRATLNWDVEGGVAARNVLHFRSTSGTESELAAAFASNATHNMFACKANDNPANSISVIKLDGSSATQVVSISPALNGNGSGGLMPSTAGVVSFRTGLRGSAGRGRIYIGPCTEDKAQAGILDITSQGLMQAAWEGFVADMATDSNHWILGVASYVHSGFHPVSSLIVDKLVGTQRRRQDQLR